MIQREKSVIKKMISHLHPLRMMMVLADVVIVNFSYWIVFYIRYFANHELLVTATPYLEAFWKFAPFYTVFCLVAFTFFRLYSGLWRFSGLNDLHRIILANLITAVFYTAGSWIFVTRMPKSIYIGGAMLQLMLITASRCSVRIFYAELNRIRRSKNPAAINVMIVGVGETARIVRKKIEGDQMNVAHPVCLFTTRISEANVMIDGLPVLTGMEFLQDYIAHYHVDCVILADSLMTPETRRDIKKLCAELDIGVQDFSGYFQSDANSRLLQSVLEYTTSPIKLIVDGVPKRFDSGEQALMALEGKHDIRAMFAQENVLVIELGNQSAERNNTNEAWVREFEQETGESVSFF